MSALVPPSVDRSPAFESATRVAVVAALAATTMLFASLVSAYLVRRSFTDWRPAPTIGLLALAAFALAASGGLELAARGAGARRRLGLISLALSSGLYLLGALALIASTMFGPGGLESPFRAFVALLLGVHLFHAIVGGAFAASILRDESGQASDQTFLLARWVIHFLTVLLCAIVFLLVGLQ